MKVIDLLNKIANGEEVPKKINYEGISYTYDDYITDYKRTIGKDLFTYLFTENRTETFLNNEVEIIEEDEKIEPLMNCINAIRPNEMSSYYEKEKLEDIVKHNFDVIHKKINEIIDKLNEGE